MLQSLGKSDDFAPPPIFGARSGASLFLQYLSSDSSPPSPEVATASGLCVKF